VLDDFGKLGRSWRELDENATSERDMEPHWRRASHMPPAEALIATIGMLKLVGNPFPRSGYVFEHDAVVRIESALCHLAAFGGFSSGFCDCDTLRLWHFSSIRPDTAINK
jgi:hypothetical protein